MSNGVNGNPIKAGDKVRVFDGPLAGINGVVADRNSENRALILMELLGRPTKVDVDALMLQRTGQTTVIPDSIRKKKRHSGTEPKKVRHSGLDPESICS